MSANSGAHLVIGSSSRIRPWSTSVRAVATVTGLLIEAMGKIVPRSIGSLRSISRRPAVWISAMRPLRQTRVTTPGKSPVAMAFSAGARTLASPSEEKPPAPLGIVCAKTPEAPKIAAALAAHAVRRVTLPISLPPNTFRSYKIETVIK